MKYRARAVAAAMMTTGAHADEAAVRTSAQRMFPDSEAPTIAKTPVPGLFEAVVGGRVFYITEDGSHALSWPLIDTRTRRNLTETRLSQINKIPFDTLNTKLAIFEDPDCPYCKVLEKTLKDVADLTVYFYLFPIDQFHPEAAAKSRAVWCVPDRAKAWAEVMQTSAVPAESAKCDDPIAQIVAIAKQHRIKGTPTMVLADGTRLVGAVPPARSWKPNSSAYPSHEPLGGSQGESRCAQHEG
jgi:thiol:disulfide interchange protein DsbC